MTDLLVQNNLSSALCIFLSWWMAHQCARRGSSGRLIAIAAALLGLSMLFTALARNLAIDPRPLIVASKYVLAAMLALLVYRNHRAGLDRKP